MKYIVTFDVDKGAYLKFLNFTVKRACQTQSQFKAFAINLVAWLFITVFFMFIFQSFTSKVSSIDLSSALVGALPFCLIIGYSMYANFNARKFSIPNKQGIILGAKSIELTPEGITETSAVSKCHYSWSCVEEVTENSGDYYIFLDKMFALIIPSSAFVSQGSIEQFKSYINKYV
ncbi:YcxB family protein [Alteromonas stellipolaris]|uniref:YcxB family protein n=1 Tax=Alteromonas stellipolaris TaxID=233316 RepID=UPI0026E2268C|nr:YcxB family protein [Alteromonas stellipolaris]MDO6538134.1 YcxB family protein [Alteromonas stellipolaris]MDP2596179.1 YcxB family protein [Alteromonas stellipolaris]